MKTGFKFRRIALAGALALAPAAMLIAPQQAGQAAPAAQTDWSRRISTTPMGAHMLGNPLAKTRLVEYMSYTCPHCAHFEEEAYGPIRKLFVGKGNISFEVRNLLRDPVDMTVALLARCGGKSKFFANHKALLARQSVWLGKAASANQQGWYQGPFDDRLKKISADIGLYDEMATLGFTRAQADACLTDKAAQKAVLALSKYGSDTDKVNATPSFTINGKLLDNVHDWKKLEGALTSG
ncbi:MAG: thioredoxin domain-containing protein [Blastomonas sp.]